MFLYYLPTLTPLCPLQVTFKCSTGTGQLSVWSDEEGDFLEITLDHETGFFGDLGNGVFERVDEEGNTIGFAVLNVKARKERELPFDAEFTRLPS